MASRDNGLVMLKCSKRLSANYKVFSVLEMSICDWSTFTYLMNLLYKHLRGGSEEGVFVSPPQPGPSYREKLSIFHRDLRSTELPIE